MFPHPVVALGVVVTVVALAVVEDPVGVMTVAAVDSRRIEVVGTVVVDMKAGMEKEAVTIAAEVGMRAVTVVVVGVVTAVTAVEHLLPPIAVGPKSSREVKRRSRSARASRPSPPRMASRFPTKH